MDYWMILSTVGLLLLHFQGNDGQTTEATIPCPSKTQVGDNPGLAITSQTNMNHGQSRTVVLYDAVFIVQCCGVITSWDLQVYTGPDGCSATTPCKLDFMVFSNVDLTTKQAKLIGINADKTVVRPASGFLTINIPADEQIPVKYGDVLGYSGLINAVEYVDDNRTQLTCSANSYACSQNYMMTDANKIINSKNVGQTYNFQEVGSFTYPDVYRFYAFRANVEKGPAPKFTNIPTKINIPSTTAVGTKVFNVTATDDNKLNKLTMNLVRQCPIGNYFVLNNQTGEISVGSSLTNAPYLTHTLTIDVTDGCQTTTDVLQITVIGPTANTTTTPSPNSNSGSNGSGLLSTKDGQILVGLLAATLALLVATCVGLCCLCYQLRSIMKGNQTGSYSDPYSNDSQPYYRNNQSNPKYQNGQNNPGNHSYPFNQNGKPDNLPSDYVNEPRPLSYRVRHS